MKSVVLLVVFLATFLSANSDSDSGFDVDYMQCFEMERMAAPKYDGVFAYGKFKVTNLLNIIGDQAGPACQTCVDATFGRSDQWVPFFTLCYSNEKLMVPDQTALTLSKDFYFVYHKDRLEIFNNVTNNFIIKLHTELSDDAIMNGRIAIGPVHRSSCFMPKFEPISGMKRINCRIDSVRENSEPEPLDEIMISIFIVMVVACCTFAHHVWIHGSRSHDLQKPKTDEVVVPGLYDLD